MYSKKLKSKLEDIIVAASMNEDFIRNPETDFSRSRKLGFTTTFNSILSMGGNSLGHEMLELFEYKDSLPTTSAFVQAREKILPSAFSHVFFEFTKSLKKPKKYRKYNLYAVDGSILNLYRNPNDLETFVTQSNTNGRNMMMLTAMYDLCNSFYTDVTTQSYSHQDERGALISMLLNLSDKSIVTVDRGYESYNVFAHFNERNLNYVCRVKDISSNGILSGFNLPCEEFDNMLTVNVSNFQKKRYKSLPNYKFSPSITRFDFSTHDNPIYQLSFRVVRFKLESGKFESIITNLGYEFSSEDIKYLYKLRWGIETSFRQLKYAIGLANFHAKKKDSIIQEIYARLTLHNFCESIIQNTIIRKRNSTHNYKINFTRACQVCRKFIRFFNTTLFNVEALISKFLTIIRPNRSYSRNMKPKKFTSFVYRVS